MELVINIHALKNCYGISKAIDICKEAGFTAMDYYIRDLHHLPYLGKLNWGKRCVV
jgi:hypothetical protein